MDHFFHSKEREKIEMKIDGLLKGSWTKFLIARRGFVK